MEIKHKAREQDAAEALNQQLERAQDSGRWFVVTYRIEGDQIHQDYVSWNFPKPDFGEGMLGMFQELLKRLGEPEIKEPEPLQIAEFLQGIKEDQERKQQEKEIDQTDRMDNELGSSSPDS